MLGLEYAKYEIGKAIMKEFLARGLDKVYAEEIKAWKKYLDEQKFAGKLDKQMKKEVERFRKEIKVWQPKKLEKFVIEGLDCLKPGM